MIRCFTLSKHVKHVIVSNWVKRGKHRNKRQQCNGLENKRKEEKEERPDRKPFCLFHKKAVGRRSMILPIPCCLNTLLIFHNVPYTRSKNIEKGVEY